MQAVHKIIRPGVF